MRKIFVGVVVIMIFSLLQEGTVNKKIIPDEAIRFRILANSNSLYDQDIKEKVSAELQSNMYDVLKNTQTVDDARKIIKTNIDNFSNAINSILKKENYSLGYNIDFGMHSFPKKEYKGIEYDEGNYESLLVKLGTGSGENWWCVLFPPLCLLEAQESSDVEYKFFVQELIDKFF